MPHFQTRSLILAAAALAVTGAPALAEQACSEHKTVLGQFASTYKEAPVAGGLTRDGHLLQVLSSGDIGTWTIVLSKPDGETCVVMAGEAWHRIKRKPSPQDPDA